MANLSEIDYPELTESIKAKIAQRGKKRQKKMLISGKRVFQLKELKKKK